MMGINWKIRFKNPLFWMSLFGVISCTLGIEPDELKTWAMVLEEIK
ncbi:MAG: phage holin, partial [Anaerotignum sp.]